MEPTSRRDHFTGHPRLKDDLPEIREPRAKRHGPQPRIILFSDQCAARVRLCLFCNCHLKFSPDIVHGARPRFASMAGTATVPLFEWAFFQWELTAP